MPRYKCHKEVHALKIRRVNFMGEGVDLVFTQTEFAPIEISFPEAARFKKAMQGHLESGDVGYLVVEDGCRSWSPTKVFEDGYARL